jgi:hypothetical protein
VVNGTGGSHFLIVDEIVGKGIRDGFETRRDVTADTGLPGVDGDLIQWNIPRRCWFALAGVATSGQGCRRAATGVTLNAAQYILSRSLRAGRRVLP